MSASKMLGKEKGPIRSNSSLSKSRNKVADLNESDQFVSNEVGGGGWEGVRTRPPSSGGRRGIVSPVAPTRGMDGHANSQVVETEHDAEVGILVERRDEKGEGSLSVFLSFSLPTFASVCV